MANVNIDAETTTVGRLQPFLFPLVALVGGAIQVGVWGTPFAETFLRWFLVVTVGVQGIWAFLGHYFRSDNIAAYIGWPAGNPFQKEVAFANLAFGTLGVLCFWLRDGFWTATVVGISVFMFGATVVHLREIRASNNRSPGNAGAILLTDVLIPVVLLALLVTTRL